jgi:hypothetical protein
VVVAVGRIVGLGPVVGRADGGKEGVRGEKTLHAE